MKRVLVFAFLLCMVLLVRPGQGYRLTDDLYFAIPNDTIGCIDVILPDDSGFMGMGEYEYILTCSSNWSDLTEQIIRTDENNTVRIPICFSGFGRADGDCSPPFTIGISSANLGIKNEWNGGVCISKYPDFDIVDETAEDEDDVRDILDGNFDLFDIGFSLERMYSEPDESVIYSLLVESYASLTIDLNAKTGLSVIPTSETVYTSSFYPFHTIYFTVQAPSQSGEYVFDVEAKVRNCEGIFCSKTARGTLVVNESLPEIGFSAYLFPKSINVKNLEPILYTLTIQNHGKAKIFSIRIDIDPVTTTDFEWRDDVIVLEDSKETINFTVTPDKVSSLYEIEVTVIYEGLEKKASTSLSTNEMLTDAMRDADSIKNSNPNLAGDVNSALDDWYNSYKNSDYGADLDDYTTLKDSFADLRNQTDGAGPPGPYTPGEPGTDGEDQEGMGWLWVVMIIIIILVVVIILVIFFKKSKKTEETEEEYF